ncbi:MAG: Fe-only nitrogenase subunit delta [Proteiniphilum sp.]|jgi:nitrogenase delta subunit|uniref:Fe-only nitrogenase subunit delta n=1 Tax=Proteiniphilum sp. TaxID=1926877 RepID=UPI002B21CE02|nr:Fe-only nitrogenase subunit delta [Proteiniphilum sp.]MEA5129402.1 Fe-only nitrogenase subunit delta [Proteiniphilum sp.]
MDKKTAEEKMSQLEWYITKHCLWQYNSRGWDREIQNERILTKTRQLLCGENALEDNNYADRYYWSEAATLVEAFKRYFPWLEKTSKEEITEIMNLLKEKMDYMMIKGSLNSELIKPQY